MLNFFRNLRRSRAVATSSVPSPIYAPLSRRWQNRLINRALPVSEYLETRVLLAATPQLVIDINTGLGTGSVGELQQAGDRIYFTATTDQGTELWKTDGSRAGTRLVKDIQPGPDSGIFQLSAFASIGDISYFVADDGIHGQELWRTDGSDVGTWMVKDIDSRTGRSSSPAHLTVLGGLLYFSARDEAHFDALWVSDGTEAGTQVVKDVRPGNTASSQMTGFVAAGGNLFFSANNGVNGSELWVSDGTAAGTQMVSDINAGSVGSFPNSKTALGNAVYFTANDGVHGIELWKSDGTPGGTSLVADISSGSSTSSPGFLTVVGQSLFFKADDDIHGSELWKTDHLSGVTNLVKDINSGQWNSNPGSLAELNGTLIFRADGGTSHGRTELWKSDGTEAGTVLLKDIRPGSGHSSPGYMKAIGDEVFFLANDGVHGEELWKTDGTPMGTVLVRDIDPSPTTTSFRAPQFTQLNDTLVFARDDGLTGYELWRSDGTESGTLQVKDIRHGVGSNIRNLTNAGGALYFSADDGSSTGNEIWRSTGTGSGTGLLKDIWPGTKSSDADHFTAFDDKVFFTADDGDIGTELWATDGTPDGTTLFKDINAGWNDSSPEELTVVDDRLFFSADSSALRELWMTDGTPSGTSMVKDIQPHGGAYPEQLTNVNGTLFFSARSGFVNDRELWKSDGTEQGTVQVKNINPILGFDIGDSNPEQLTSFNGSLIFTALDGTHGRELWISDGTENGTLMLKDINPGSEGSSPESFTELNGKLYFSAFDPANGRELWVTDGTTVGTALVKNIGPGDSNSHPRFLKAVGDTLFFSANDGERGTELWKSDGTEVGTARVFDIFPGPDGANPEFLENANGTLVFSADDGQNGPELWQSDGTEEGTTLVADMNNVSPFDGSFPRDMTRVQNYLFFVATDHAAGGELWLLSESDLPELTFDVASREITESAGVVRVEATLSAAQNFDVTFPVSVSGSATFGGDYSFVTNPSLFFPAGETTGWLDLEIANDAVQEGIEAINIGIDSTALALFGAISSQEILIQDDDSLPGVSFVDATQVTTETATDLTVEVALSSPSVATVTVPLVVSGTASSGSDYTISETTITIPVGSTSAFSTISIVDDEEVEPAERIDFSLGTPTNAIISDDPTKPLTHSTIISANDLPTVSFESVFRRVNEDAGIVSVPVRLSEVSPVDVSVPFTVGGPSDDADRIVSPSNTLTISAGTLVAFIDITVIDDEVPEGFNEGVRLHLEAPQGALLGEITSQNIGIRDNDTPVLKFSGTPRGSVQHVYESAGSVEFTVTVEPVSAVDIHFNLNASGQSGNQLRYRASRSSFDPTIGDFGLPNSSFVIPAGESSVSGTILINEDGIPEDREFFSVWIEASPTYFHVGDSREKMFSILDNDLIVTLERFAHSPTERLNIAKVREDDTEILFYPNLSGPAESTIDIPFQVIGDASLGTDYTVTPSNGVVRIEPGQTFYPDGIRVNLKEDILVEGTEKFTVILGEPVGGATLGNYVTSTVEILDDDLAPTVSFGFNSKFANEADGTVLVPLEMTTQTNKDAYITFEVGGTAERNVDYVIEGVDRNNRLKLPAFSNQANLGIRIIDDGHFDPGESIDLRISSIENAAILNTTGRVLKLHLFDNDARATPPKPEPSTSYARYVDEANISAGQLALPENLVVGPVPTVKSADDLSHTTGALALPPSHQHGEVISYRTTIGGRDSTQAKRDMTFQWAVGAAGEFYKASQGFLHNATAFLDGNLNGVPDFLDLNGNGIQEPGEPQEPVLRTELDGAFSMIIPDAFDRNGDGLLQAAEGRVIITGGVDSAIDVPWNTHMVAPPGFRLATPITTLIASLIYEHEQSVEDAELRIMAALGLEGVDVREIDSLYEIVNGDAIAALEYTTHVQVYNTVSGVTALFAGITGQSQSAIGNIVYGELGRKILSDDSLLDLTSDTVISDLIRSIAFRVGSTVSEEIVLGTASILAEGNGLVTQVQPPIDIEYARAVTRIKKVIQGDVAIALSELDSQAGGIALLVQSYTGTNLQNRVANAQIGMLIPPVIGVTDSLVREGGAGATVLDFFVEIAGSHEDPVTVDFSTFDMTATVADGDYAGTSGTLYWNPGDSSTRTVSVTVNGDTDFEPDEFIRLHLSNPSNAVLRVEDGYGFIVNDDASVLQTAAAQTPSHTEIQMTQNTLRVSENGKIIADGDFLDPLQYTVNGLDDQSDTLLVDLSENAFRPDTIVHHGGGGSATDIVKLAGGNFARVSHDLTAMSSGQTTLLPILSSNDVTVEWTGSESVHLHSVQIVELIVALPQLTGEVIVEDADPDDSDPELAGKMSLRSAAGSFTPLLFTPPDTVLRLVPMDNNASLTVASTDPSFSGTIELAGQANQPPTELAITSTVIPENSAPETVVGMLSSTDPDAGDTFTYTLVAGDGDSDNGLFSIDGDQLKISHAPDFETASSYSVRVRTTDSGGLTFEKALTISVEDLDETAPTATIQPLPLTSSSSTITLEIAVNDPDGPAGEPVSGVTGYDVFVAIDNGPWTMFAADVPHDQTQVIFAAEAGHRYWFRAVAVDLAGNAESDPGVAEANTLTLDFEAPSTNAVSASTDTGTGIIQIQISGTDTGGSGLAWFEVFVSVDNRTPEQVIGSPLKAGAASSGQWSAVAEYQAIADGQEHSYRFYTIGVDGGGNREAAPSSPNDVTETVTLTAQPGYNATGIDVQFGQTQRSYVNTVDVLFSNSVGLIDLFNSGRIELERFGIGSSNVTRGTGSMISGFGASALGNALRLDFGRDGIGGRGALGDGFYRISLDLDGDGDADDAHFEFFRLWGDANGNGSVTRDEHRSLFEDLNGDGRIDSRDRLDVRRQIGQSLNSLLLQFLDD